MPTRMDARSKSILVLFFFPTEACFGEKEFHFQIWAPKIQFNKPRLCLSFKLIFKQIEPS